MKTYVKKIIAGAMLLVSTAALADYTIKDSTGTTKTVFAFVCQTTKICSGSVPINSSGTETATASNPLRTDPTGTTPQPISGSISNTAFGATQSGVWTVQPGNTPNTTAWLVTGAGGTFPITASSLPLPTGAATQTTLASVLTATPTLTTWAGGTLGAMANYGTSPGAVLVPGVNAFITNVPHVVCDSGCSGSGGTSSNYGSAFPAAGTAIGYTDGTNMVAGRVVSAGADAISNTTTQIFSAGFNYIYNGTTWDRVRGTSGAVNVACTSGCSGAGGTSSAFGSAFPANGTAIGLTNGTNMIGWSATTNYGTAPSAIAVPAVNAFVTNSNANGSNTSANSSPVVIANDQAAVATKLNTTPSIANGNGVIAIGPTADGTAAANPPVLVAGTTDGTATGAVAIPKITAGGVLSVDASATTQPVSGTVTANQGTANTVANGWPAKITDGTNTAAVKAASTPSPATDPSLSVTINAGSNGLITTGPATDANSVPVVSIPSSNAAVAITPVVTSTAASNVVLKASAGNIYGVEVTTGGTAGYLMLFNATTAPADGTVTPVYCKVVAANSSVELSWTAGPPAAFATGITAVFSSTGCFTKTASATAFISGMVK